MATANNIIKRGLRLINAHGTGETMSPDMSSDGLMTLNAMISSWSLEKLMLFKFETVSYVPTAASFTIGATGQLVTTRPVEILSAYRRSGGLDTDVRIGSRADYERESLKAQTGPVEFLYYKPTLPNGTVFCWPVPTGGTLFMTLQQPLTAFDTLVADVALPDGYEEALAFNFAVYAGPEYGTEASATVQRRAQNAKRLIKTANNEIPRLELDPAMYGGSSNQWWTPPQ